MTNRFRAVLLMSVVLLAAVLAPPAGAAAGSHVVHTTLFGFELRGSNGYTISVDSFQAGELDLSALSDDAGFFVDYLLRARTAGGRLRANLGKLGRISVRFVNPSGRVKTFHTQGSGCGARITKEETGFFRGIIRFRGEMGYTAASARSAAGTLDRAAETVCPGQPGRTERSKRLRRPLERVNAGEVGLKASSTSGGRRLEFLALRIADPGRWGFIAAQTERRGRISIAREALLAGVGGEPVVLGDATSHPASVIVSPPPPFAGTGTFTRTFEPPSLTWSGSLTAFLPGAGTVPLTGPQFTVSACHLKGEFRFESCLNATEPQS